MSYKLRRPRAGKSDYWQAIIRTPDGRTIERSTKCTRKTEADAVAAKWDRDAALSRHQVSLEQAFEHLRAKMVDKGAASASFEILYLKAAHVLGYFGRERPVDTIGLADTLGYMRHRRAKGVSDSTIAKELGCLRASLRCLKRLKMYDGEPRDIWPEDELQASKPRDRWLTMQEYEALLLTMAAPTGYFRKQRHGVGRHGGADHREQWIQHKEPLGQDWRDQLVAYVYTGARFSELYRIEAAHIEGDHLRIVGTKTEGAQRLVPLHPEAAAVLERRAKTYPRGPLFPLASPDVASQKRAWLRALGRACERSSIPHASTNDLRRTFCSWAFQSGVPESVCVRWMGHTSARMVREVYAQMSVEQGRSEIEKLPSPSRRTSHVFPRTTGGSGHLNATQGNKKPAETTKRRLNG